MNQLRRVLLLACVLLAPIALRAASEGETAALTGLEAMNRNQGERFVAIAHSKLVRKICEILTSRLEISTRQSGGDLPFLAIYGVKSLEEFKKLSPENVTRTTIDHMGDPLPDKLRTRLRTAKFSIVRSEAFGPEALLVTIAVEVAEENSTQKYSVDLLSKLEGTKWKYWGFPELAKGF